MELTMSVRGQVSALCDRVSAKEPFVGASARKDVRHAFCNRAGHVDSNVRSINGVLSPDVFGLLSRCDAVRRRIARTGDRESRGCEYRALSLEQPISDVREL